MMDRLESMSILVSVAEAGSLSAASRRLGTPLATVSRKVAELEAHLRTRLLNRSSRRLTLTDAGQSYVAACRQILEQIEEAERAASGEFSAPKGHLVITAPVVFGRLHVLPVAAAFLDAYPDIDIRLVLADRLVNLLEEHVDLAVRIGELPDSSLIAMRIGEIRHVVCGSPAYFAAHGMAKTPDDLAAHQCITFQGLMSPERWTFAAARTETSVRIHSRLVVNTAEAAIDAAIAGLGVTRVLSYQAAQAVRDGALVIVLAAFELPPWPVNLVFTGGGPSPLKLRAFLDFAAPRLKARLARAMV
jgi:DNA-binding transcriptional LysR family regulator